MNRVLAALACGVAAASLASATLPLRPLLIWNASESLPTGLYRLGRAAALVRGERVAIAPPPALAAFLARRGYLPQNVPLMKEIAGLGGDRICRRGSAITINGAPVARALAADTRGRALPVWRGCLTLAADQIFVLNRRARDSFDGRYFGPLARGTIIGRALPLWTDETGDGAHVLFARTAAATAPIALTGDRP